MTAAPRAKVAVVLCLAGMVAIGGCGGDDSASSEASVEQRIERAKQEGAEAARRQQRLEKLERKVRRLERQSGGGESDGGRAVVVAPAEEEPTSTVLRSFRAPSGNVSCQILSDGALCSVASIGTTFSFADGEAATIGSGAAPPRGSGTLVPFGTTVSAGSVTCTVPESDEPRGISCEDASSGHGFEASRVPDRQRAY